MKGHVFKKKYRLANDSSLVTGWSCIYPWVKGKRKCLQEKEEDRKGYLGAEPVKVRVRQMLSLSGKVLPGIWKDFYFSPTLTHSDFEMCCAAEWCTPKTYASRTMNVCAQGKCYPCRRHFQLMEDAVSQLVQNYMTKWCTAWIQPNLNRSLFETKLNTWQFFFVAGLFNVILNKMKSLIVLMQIFGLQFPVILLVNFWRNWIPYCPRMSISQTACSTKDLLVLWTDVQEICAVFLCYYRTNISPFFKDTKLLNSYFTYLCSKYLSLV